MMTEIVSRLWLMSLQASVLILVVMIVRSALKKYPKIYCYLLWILVGVRLLCPVLVESPLSLQPAPGQVFDVVQDTEAGQTAGGTENLSAEGVQLPDPSAGNDGQGTLPVQGQGTQIAAANQTGAGTADGSEFSKTVGADGRGGGKSVPAGFWRALAIVYLTGAAGFSVFYLAQYLLMRRRVSAAVRAKGNVWYCDRITSPFVMGIFHTRIFLPYGLSEQECRHVLRHERTHIRHHDPVILFLGILCICLHWWNPLVWLAVHSMNQDMEMFCDEAALKGLPAQERKAYAGTLLTFAARQNGYSVGLAFGESNTERRVKNLMRKRRGNIFIIFFLVVLAVFCVITLLTVREAGKTQPGGDGVQSAADEPQPDEEEMPYDGSGTQADDDNRTGGDWQSGSGEPDADSQGTIGESAEDRAARYAAYRTALEDVLYNKVFPDGVECGGLGTESDPGNYFAVFDIDGDGREELLIKYTLASMAGMREAVYDYDGENDRLRAELSEFPLVTYYENGAVEAGWSHNQGLNAFSSDEFWPYNAYRYDRDADAYVKIGMVDAWDKTVSEKNYAGDAFPEEVDADGDGILYSLMDTIERYYAPDTLVDGPALAEWQESCRSNGAEIAVPWQALTQENIRTVLAGDQPGFYGRWYVWDYQMPGISAISAEDAQEYVGAEIVYETNYVRLNGAKLPAPGFTYTFADYTEEAFLQDYQANLGEWWNGISEITYGEVNTTDNDFGSHFFVVSDEVIWIYHEGVFFLARRDKPVTAVG